MISRFGLFLLVILISIMFITGCKNVDSNHKPVITEEDAIELADQYVQMLLVWDENGIKEITTGNVFVDKDSVAIPQGFDHIRTTNDIESFDIGNQTFKVVFHDFDQLIKIDGTREMSFDFIREVLVDSDIKKVKGYYYTYSLVIDHDLEFNEEDIQLQSQ